MLLIALWVGRAIETTKKSSKSSQFFRIKFSIFGPKPPPNPPKTAQSTPTPPPYPTPTSSATSQTPKTPKIRKTLILLKNPIKLIHGVTNHPSLATLLSLMLLGLNLHLKPLFHQISAPRKILKIRPNFLPKVLKIRLNVHTAVPIHPRMLLGVRSGPQIR